MNTTRKQFESLQNMKQEIWKAIKQIQVIDGSQITF